MSEPKEPITLYVRKEKISHRSDVAPTHIDRTDSSPAQEVALRLHDRGWVFQERFLATRTMHFTKAELGWSCPSVETCECMGLLLDFELSSPEISMRGLNTCTKAWAASFVGGKGWINLVEKYSRRALTRETDLLPALSGIAETLTISGDKYAFGLWKSGIQRGDQLCWFPAGGVTEFPPPVTYAPSWSWASIRSDTSFHDWGWSTPYRWLFDFVDLSCEPTTSNPFGPGIGMLRLSGYLVPVRWYDSLSGILCSRNCLNYHITNTLAFDHASDPDPRGMFYGGPMKEPSGEVDVFGARLAQTLENLLVQFQPDVELSATSNEDTDIFFFMLVETTRGIPVADSVVIRNPHGIILKPVSSEGEPCYKRIGWGSGEFIDKYQPTEWWKTCGTRQIITII